VGFEGNFANWVGTLFKPSEKYIIYGSDEQTIAAVKRLLRIGYINVVGYADFPLK
jgi:hypothetical protein